MLSFPLWKKLLVGVVALWGLLVTGGNFLPAGLLSDQTSWLPGARVTLGLDLKGGAHLLLEVDSSAVVEERLDGLEDNIRRDLRAARIRAHSFNNNGEELRFQLAEAEDSSATLEQVQQIIRTLDPALVTETSLSPPSVRTGFSEEARLEILDRALEQSIEVIRRRVDEFGTTEPLIQRQGSNRILVQAPGISDTGALKALLNATARLTFHLVEESLAPSPSLPVRPGKLVLYDDENPDQAQEILVMGRRPIVGGESLENAQSTFQDGRAVVSFTFDTTGARLFGEATGANVGERLAIVLDDTVVSAPVINEPILGGSGIISGNFTVQSAETLAILLRAGALPAPLQYIEERSVGPGLGQDSVESGRLASGLAIIFVALFMALTYRRFGVYAAGALLLNLAILLALITAFRITLTLPGIAGLILTIGMAVDANVLIFERIREELRSGRSVSGAVDAGYRRAFTTIIDSNLTTLIAAILLFAFGSGPIKGFAVTLSIGILTSMFTAIMITRMFVVSWLWRARPKILNL